MSQADNFSDGEFATVIAAAAYAIASLEEKEGSQKRRRSLEISGASLPKTKSRNEDTNIKLSSFRGSFKRWFADQEAKEDEKPRGSTRVGKGQEMRPGPAKASSTTKFPTSSFGNRSQDEYPKEQTATEAEADAWEKEQMIKIRNRYDKMMSMIIEWENEKKTKAKSHMERKKNEPEPIRARALQKYEDEISRINKVAGEAKALAEERRRNDETKARAKAAKIRLTGRVPRTYCCC